MALTYTDLYNIWRAGGELNARVQVAMLKYAQYLLAKGTAATSVQQTWCKAALQQDTQIASDAMQIMKFVVTDATFMGAGGVVTDDQVQTIVETWVNTVLLG